MVIVHDKMVINVCNISKHLTVRYEAGPPRWLRRNTFTSTAWRGDPPLTQFVPQQNSFHGLSLSSLAERMCYLVGMDWIYAQIEQK